MKSIAIILREEFGIPFQFFDAATGRHLPELNDDPVRGRPAPPSGLDAGFAAGLAARGMACVRRLDVGYELAFPLPAAEGRETIAVGVLGGLARTPAEVLLEQDRLGKWLQSVQLRLLIAQQSSGRHRPRHGSDPEGASIVGLQALIGLEQLLRTQRIDKEPATNRRQVLQTAAKVLRARSLLWVPAEGDDPMIEGEPLVSPWDCRQLARLLLQGAEAAKAGYLLNNQVRESSWGGRFPRVFNVLAVPVPIRSPKTWLIALNKTTTPASGSSGTHRESAPAPGSSGGAPSTPSPGESQFRRTDVALLLPFAALLGVHARAAQRARQVHDLTIGLTRALAAAVDARDLLAAGHSERVARIAVELARELGLQEDELSDVYLCGLLHDVGTIGLSDAVLRKRGPTAADEVARLRRHVTLGATPLAELPQFAHLLPAVLHHQERYDGTGYPDGLKGDTIPLLARIIAVAESYDAMVTSGGDRPEAVRATVEAILSRGADAQWDGRVIAAFFRCRERIHAIQRRGLVAPFDGGPPPPDLSDSRPSDPPLPEEGPVDAAFT